MITQIVLKGFQSHVNTVFNLQNGLNVITGPSDSGKTAIIRAIRWIAFNEPQGEAFVNENVGEATVILTLQNGNIITKHRRKGKTSYIVQQDSNDEGSIFEKSEVPLEVKRLLGIEKTSFGDFETALNFSFQLDAPFLISETASAGAKVLGKLAGTESVDLAIKGVSKDTHATRMMRSQAEKDIERATGDLFDYLNIDNAKESLERAESIFETVESNYELVQRLSDYKYSHGLKSVEVVTINEKLKTLQEVPQLIQKVSEIEKDQQRLRDLKTLQDDGNHLTSRISSLVLTLRKYKDTELIESILAGTEVDQEKLSIINSLRQLYQKYTNDVREADETLNNTKGIHKIDELLNTIDLLRNSMHDLRNTQEECKTTLNKLNVIQAKLDTFKNIHETDSLLTAVEENEKRLAVLKELIKEHLLADQSLENVLERYRQADWMITISEKELQQAWDDAGGVCPLCESAVCEHG